MAKAKKLTKGQSRRIRDNQSKKLNKAKDDISWQDTDLGEVLSGIVISRFGQHADIESEDGTIYRCNIRRTVNNLVCGDNVLWRLGKETQNSISGVVEAVKPRLSELVRPDVYDGIKAVAANINQLFIVSSINPAFNPDIIDRYLVAAEQTNIKPIILLNKSDLISEEQQDEVDQILANYEKVGYLVLRSSCKNENGIAELQKHLVDQTNIFVGQSGVGKSTLVNTLMPELSVHTQQVSENSGLGQHTTTVARLYHFPGGGRLIDSPGIREFGVWHMEPENVFEGFIEFEPYAGLCKFRDCKHDTDPGCVLRQAKEDGDICSRRFDSYHKIVKSIGDNKLTSRFN